MEFKGQEHLDVPQKMAWLCQWCEDINRVQQAPAYAFDDVVQKRFEKDQPTSFKALVMGFKE